MFANRAGIKKLWTQVVGDQSSASKFPVLNDIIMAYIGVTLVCYVLFLIAPFVTFISQTPLRHIQSYLGILGGVLLCADLFTNKVVWRGPYCVLLYGLCALALVAMLTTLSYGISDNLFIICWTAIEFSLFYSCVYRWGWEKLQRYFKWLYGIVLLCWLVACCISLYQYVFQIGYRYVVNPFSDDNSVARQGFLDSRLFGIFTPLNHAVYVSFMLLAAGIYYLIHTRRGIVKAGLTAANLVLLFHIILSGSRSAQVSMVVCVLGASWLWFRNRTRYTDFRRILIPCGMALVVTVVCLLGFMGVKAGLEKVPSLVKPIAPSGEIGETLPQKDDLDIAEEQENILYREGLEEDVSNDRFKIWSDYLSLYDEIGLLGLSPGNYMAYILENHPDLFIVQYIQEEYPGKFINGTIYHVHNGYLMVFVSTGFAGVLLMLAFILLCFVRLVRYLYSQRRVSDEFIFALAIVAAGAISAVFDKGVFFMNNPSTFLFWGALGIVMAEIQRTKQA